MKYDIVYVLRQDITSEELKYSLRSVCENFDYNQIWFYGGCPSNIQPDKYVAFIQHGHNKWERTRSMFRTIMTNDEITEDFYLFNDDFFIMQPYDQNMPLITGTLDDHMKRILARHNWKHSGYTQGMLKTIKTLETKGLDTLSYATHTPLLINRKKGLEVLNNFNSDTQFRSTYGNYAKIGGKVIKDPKISLLDTEPDPNCYLLSTSDKSFRDGKVGQFIRNRFPNKCKYEK